MTNASGVRQVTPAQLKALIDSGESLFMLDVRNEEEFKAWRVEGRKSIPTLHKPYFEVLEEGDGDDVPAIFANYARQQWEGVLPRDQFILVVCAKGGTSALAAEGLVQAGYRAGNLDGGMLAWGNFYDIKPVAKTDSLSVWQVARTARGCLSYVLASGNQAVIVDPLRHTDRYLEFAALNGLTITAVLDTHGHADHISGGPTLAKQLGIPYYVHPYDAIHPLDVMPATIDYEPLRADQVIPFGNSRIQAIHIPGHTLGNIAYLVDGQYLLSGDSIFIESIARPDLGGHGEQWSPLHFRSLSKLLALGDDVVVLPGHFSSPVEAGENGLYAQSLGALKQANEGLRKVQEGQEPFVSFLLQSLPTFPPQYVEIKRVNAGLLVPSEEKADELELGRNICALSQAYKEE